MSAPEIPVVAVFPHKPPPQTPKPFSAAEFGRRQMTARPWLVPDLLPGCQVSTIDGDGGLGKSTLGLQLAVAGVTGRSWLNQTVAPGPVLYLSAEDDQDEVHRRLDSICTHYQVEFDALADLHVWPLAESDPALVTSTRDDALAPTARWDELLEAIDRIKPVALILDSRADVFGGNEVSRAQARAFIGMLRGLAVKSRLAVVLLAHPSLSGMSSGSGSSGSTHWRNAVRSALYLTKSDDTEGGDPDARLLSVKKSNYGPGGLSLRLRWTAGAFAVENEGLGLKVDRATALAGVDALFLEMLTTYQAQGRRVSDATGAAYAPALFAKDPASGGTAKAGFVAAMNRLFSRGEIVVETVGPASKQRRQLVRVGGQ